MDNTVLVIEDNMMNMEMLCDWLEAHQFSVLSAFDAQEGIELAQLHQPNLILMDIALPRMDGIAATRILKENPKSANIPVIAVTASSMRINLENLKEAGCEHVVFKPIDFSVLKQKIHEVLGIQ